MNRREAMKKAWTEVVQGDIDPNDPIIGMYRLGFENGYLMAWGALLSEIRPLVDDMHSASVLKRADLNTIMKHRRAVERLRELVREGE